MGGGGEWEPSLTAPILRWEIALGNVELGQHENSPSWYLWCNSKAQDGSPPYIQEGQSQKQGVGG